MREGISSCIIGKNEENNLNRCLQSIKDVVDEIIYLDTGSTDLSIEIARRFNAKIYEGIFNDDFSKVRNQCISYANFSLILVIDCDEELSLESRDKVRELLKRDKAEGFMVDIVNYVNGKSNDKFHSIRLFKNRKEYRFKGKIHEQISYAIVKAFGVESLVSTDIKINHYGYESSKEKLESKTKRNLRILESISKEDRDGFYYYNLGNEYAKLFDFHNALINYEESLKLCGSDEIYSVFLYERMAHCYYGKLKYEKVIDIAKKGLEGHKNHMFFHYIMGLAYGEQMKFSKALESLLRAKALLQNTNDEVQIGMGIEKKEEFYEIIKELEECVMPHFDSMLTTIIDGRGEKKILKECIFSINEISSEVIVILNNGSFKDISDITDYKVKTMSKALSIEEVLKELENEIKTEYVLYLNANEGLTFEDEMKLGELLSYNKLDIIAAHILKTNITERRVIRKNLINNLKTLRNNEKSNIKISYF